MQSGIVGRNMRIKLGFDLIKTLMCSVWPAKEFYRKAHVELMDVELCANLHRLAVRNAIDSCNSSGISCINLILNVLRGTDVNFTIYMML